MKSTTNFYNKLKRLSLDMLGWIKVLQAKILVPYEDVFIRFHHIRVEKAGGIPLAYRNRVHGIIYFPAPIKPTYKLGI
jgi:hypothetical protein